MIECGCERGGDCTKTTVCAMNNALEDLREALDRVRELPLKITDDEPSPHRMAQLIEDAISG